LVSRAFEVFGFEPMIELIKRYSVACCIGLLAVTPLYAQEDTSRNEMGFDLGITRGWNIDLWPLLRIQKTEEKRDIQLVWPIFKYQTHFQRKENTTRLLPLFVADSSERIRDLRLGSVYYPSLFRFTNSYERQVKSFKLLELAPEINFFEVSRSLDGLFIKNNAFFFIWYKNDRSNDRLHLVLFPVYWQFHHRERWSYTLFPIYTSGTNHQGQTRYSAITPLYWHFTKPGSYRNVLFPFYWNRRDSVSGYNVFAPVVWQFSNPRYRSFTLFPLYSGGSSTKYKKGYRVVTPLFWQVYNGDFRFTTLFPVYWRSENGLGYNRRQFSAVLPFYWARRSNLETSRTFWPFVWQRKDPMYQSLTVVPLFSAGHSPDNSRRHLAITPFFWNWVNGSAESNTLFPIFFSYRDDDTDNRVLFPLVWSLRNPRSSSFAILPFFTTSRTTDGLRKSFSVTPLFWHVKTPRHCTNIFVPVLWNSTRYYQDDTLRRTLLAPLYWAMKDKKRENVVLFPFYWKIHNRQYHSSTVVPFVSMGKSKDSLRRHLVVTPFYWYFKSPSAESYSLFPLWWNRKSTDVKENSHFNVVFPIYWTFSNERRRADVVFPIAWSFRNRTYKSFTLFPIYSGGYANDGKREYRAISPLYWHFRTKKAQSNTLFPLIWNRTLYKPKDTILRNVVFPLLWSFRSKEKNNLVLLPVVWSLQNPDYRSFTFLPVFSVGSSPNHSKQHRVVTPVFWQIKTYGVSSTILFPFWWDTRTGFGKSGTVSQILFPLYWRYDDAYSSNRVVFPLVFINRTDKYRSVTVLPFYSGGKSDGGKRGHRMVTPFYWAFWNRDSRNNLFIPFYWGKIKGSSSHRVLFPIYYSYSNPTRSGEIVFPIAWAMRSKTYRSFTLFPLVSVGKSTDGSRRHLALPPLFWSFKSPERYFSTLVPLYTHSIDSTGNCRFSLLYFVLRYSKMDERKSFNFLWPMCEYASDQRYKYFRVTPIIWYKKSPESSYFSVQPLFYYHSDPRSNTFNLLGILYQRSNVYGYRVSNGILWKAVYWNRYANLDREIRVLYLLYANVNREGERERSLFPFYSLRSSANGNRSVSVFLSFYNSFRKRVPGTNEFYQEQKLFWFIRYRSNIRSLEQKGVVKKGEKLRL